MNLTSCDECGVVIDKDKLTFPSNILHDDHINIDMTKAVWNGRDYVAFVECPVCKNEIPEYN